LVINLIGKIATGLNKANIPYMVMGGQAVLVYGEPRFTVDIDITLGFDIDKLNRIIEVINSLELKILIDDYQDFVKRTMVLPVQDKKTGIKIDFIFSYSEFEYKALNRTIKKKIGNHTINFISLEDLIIQKIVSGRARDIDDVRSIIVKNPKYDYEYTISNLKAFSEGLDADYIAILHSITESIK
jgi:hypothetical protein